MDLSHSMRHSSKNAIPTKPQRQPAIAQNFHIKKRGGKKKGEREEREEGKGSERGRGRKERGSSGGGGGVGMPSSRQTTRLSWDLRGKDESGGMAEGGQGGRGEKRREG